VLTGLLLAALAPVSSGEDKPKAKKPDLDVPYVPTPQAVVEKMLETAKVTKNDVVYDLGCGDGRIVVTAAKKYGCKAVGIDLDPKRVAEAKANVKKNKVEDLVEIREANALKVEDIGKASVVTLYLLPEVNLKLRPILQKELKPGSRIVSHDFDMGDWKAEKEFEMKAKDDEGDEADHTIFLWTIKKKTAQLEGLNLENALALADKKEDKEREPDVIYVPTPQGVVDKMLEMAKVEKGDVVYDLGCGDGRIPVTAAKKYGCKAWGFDVDPKRIEESLANVKTNKVGELVTIEKKDIFTLDLSKADVVTLYLLPRLNVKLIPQLEKLKKGSRIVSHDFDMEGVTPDKVVKLNAKNDRGDEREHTIYLWTVPLKKEKAKD
jgi:ribosomal protein L11 methylase PrmA